MSNELDGIRVIHVRFRPQKLDGDFERPPIRGGLTVAYRWVKGMSYIEVATAPCSEQDIFVKSIGRNLAIDNLHNGHYINIPFTKEMRKIWTPTDVVRQAFIPTYIQ
jgi:hypothetical protein